MLDLRDGLQRIASGALGALDHIAWWLSWHTRPTPCSRALDADVLLPQDETPPAARQAESSV